jgi:hypothetical protein
MFNSIQTGANRQEVTPSKAGEVNSPGKAFKERPLQVALEGFNMTTDRTLRHIQFFRSPCKAQVAPRRFKSTYCQQRRKVTLHNS